MRALYALEMDSAKYFDAAGSGFLSGWYCSDSCLYALFTSLSMAPLSTCGIEQKMKDCVYQRLLGRHKNTRNGGMEVLGSLVKEASYLQNFIWVEELRFCATILGSPED